MNPDLGRFRWLMDKPKQLYQVINEDGDDDDIDVLGTFETLTAARVLFENNSAKYCRIWQGHISVIDGAEMFHWMIPLDSREPATA